MLKYAYTLIRCQGCFPAIFFYIRLYRDSCMKFFSYGDFDKSTKLADSLSKVFSNMDSNSPRYSTFLAPSALWATADNLGMHYGPQQWIWWCALGDSSEFGDAIWRQRWIWWCVMATAVNLVICYGPQLWIWWCAMGHNSEFGYALRATAADLFIHYGPLRQIWPFARGHCVEWSPSEQIFDNFRAMGYSTILLCAMGPSVGFGYVMWAICSAKTNNNSAKPITIAQNQPIF